VKKVDVRIIAAASVNLRRQVEAGKFRHDLFYRLNVVNIALPALRERKEDLAVLADHFLKKMAEKHGKKIAGFKPETVVSLENYNWPGNVRELENVVERMVILAGQEAEYITADLLPAEIRLGAELTSTPMPANSAVSKRNEQEKKLLLEALVRNNWNQSAAARDLGLHEKTVRYRMQKFGIKKS
jgi:transcriptional regulator with PAS, ATPase and Fis domain